MALRQVKDIPTNNFATLNPLSSQGNTLSEGNLKGTAVSAGGTNSTMFVSSGKWYWEIHIENHNGDLQHGISEGHEGIGGYLGSMPGTRGIIVSGSNSNYIHYYNDGPSQGGDFGIPTWSTGDVICFLLDFDAGSISVRQNDSNWIETFTDVVKPQTPAFHNNSAGGPHVYNFGQNPDFSGGKSGGGNYQDANGQGSFYYEPPDGALALCSRNIQSVEQDGSYVQNITSAKRNFRAVTYTGNGGLNKISCGFQPDLVWVKQRHGTTAPVMADSVRGPGRFFNTDGASDEHNAADSWNTNEDSPDIETVLTNFTNNGFNVGGATNWNGNNGNYVAWCWRAAGAPADGGSSVDGSARIVNEDGTQADTTCDALASETGAGIAPQKLTANRQAGFSIVMTTGIPVQAQTYTMPHGLSKTPELSIFKNADYSDSFYVRSKFTSSLLAVNQTWGTTSHQNYWEGGAFTYPLDSNIFSVRGSAFMATTSDRLMSYHFHSVPGYSKIGMFVGSKTAFVHTGFRPAFLMIKGIDIDTGNPQYYPWTMLDNARSPYNFTNPPIYANMNKVENQRGGSTHTYGTSNTLDFLSNGFKIRMSSDWGELGSAGGFRYIYMAFAEQPGAFSNAR